MAAAPGDNVLVLVCLRVWLLQQERGPQINVSLRGKEENDDKGISATKVVKAESKNHDEQLNT